MRAAIAWPPLAGWRLAYCSPSDSLLEESCFLADFPDMKLTRSSLVTLPPLPVPGTLLMSIPYFFAMCLTAGVDRALDSELLPGPGLITSFGAAA